MTDPLKFVLNTIAAGDVQRIRTLAPALPSILNRRSNSMIWSAIVDSAGKAAAKGDSDPLKILKVFVANKLPMNDCLDSGELPLNMIFARSPDLGMACVRELLPDLNASSKSGVTPALFCFEKYKQTGLHSIRMIGDMFRQPGVDLLACDQGASLLFKGLAWLPICAANGSELSEVESVASHFVESFTLLGFDLNSPRGFNDVKIGAKINTPLSYSIKKCAQWLEWGGGAKAQRASAGLNAVVRVFIEAGANPELQVERGQQVELMQICDRAGFDPSLAAFIEFGIIKNQIDTARPSGYCVKKSRRL